MRARLSRAAYEVIAMRGHSSFRTAAIAEHAGVSEGALLHHFPNKAAVTVAAVEFALGEASRRSLKRIASMSDDTEVILTAMFEDFTQFFYGDNFWVALDISMDAQKASPAANDIRTVVTALRAPIYAAWETKLLEAGFASDKAVLAVRAASALVSGLAMRKLWTTDDQTSHFLAGLWKTFVAQLDEPKT